MIGDTAQRTRDSAVKAQTVPLRVQISKDAGPIPSESAFVPQPQTLRRGTVLQRTAEEIGEVVHNISQDRILERILKQIIDLSVPQVIGADHQGCDNRAASCEHAGLIEDCVSRQDLAANRSTSRDHAGPAKNWAEKEADPGKDKSTDQACQDSADSVLRQSGRCDRGGYAVGDARGSDHPNCKKHRDGSSGSVRRQG